MIQVIPLWKVRVALESAIIAHDSAMRRSTLDIKSQPL